MDWLELSYYYTQKTTNYSVCVSASEPEACMKSLRQSWYLDIRLICMMIFVYTNIQTKAKITHASLFSPHVLSAVACCSRNCMVRSVGFVLNNRTCDTLMTGIPQRSVISSVVSFPACLFCFQFDEMHVHAIAGKVCLLNGCTYARMFGKCILVKHFPDWMTGRVVL